MVRQRSVRQPGRGVGNSASRREILVFTEGERTEVQYLTHWHRLHRAHVLVTIDDFHGGPLQLVEQAVARLKSDRRTEKKGGGRAPSETWCVFDIDEHPNVSEALHLAGINDIRIAVSNPCLELWSLIHFRDQTAWIHRHDAQSAVGEFMTKGKVLRPVDLENLMTRHQDARQRAQHLTAVHEGNGSPPGENPSSNMWCLIDSIARI